MDESMCGESPWWGRRMPWMKGGMFFGKLLMAHADDMGITDDQLKKMRDIWMEFRKTKARSMADIQVTRIEVKQMLMQDDVDVAAVEERVRRVSNMMADLKMEGIKAMLQGREVLTADQRKQLEKLMMKKLSMMHGGQAWGGLGEEHQHHH